MTTLGLQTIGSKLFAKASALMTVEDVSEWDIASLEREAKKLVDVKPGEGWIVRSAVAALKWDVEQAEQCGRRAIESDSSAETYLNAAVTMGYLNRQDLAKNFAYEAKAIYGPTRLIVDRAISTSIATADISLAMEVINSAYDPNQGSSVLQEAINTLAALPILSIEIDRFKRELSVAYDVLTKHKRRSFGISAKVEFNEYDEPEFIAIAVNFLGQEAEEMNMQGALAYQLIEQPDWDPRTLCISLRPVQRSNDNPST